MLMPPPLSEHRALIEDSPARARYAERMSDDARNGWTESTEGDLDPDLAEEAPYSAWDAPSRGWMRPAIQAFAALGLLALLGGALLTLFAR
ncbi:MAG: hypothetical protein C4558_08155 [Dehalococcoidia bacterium]|nr:MAG: hypothetical protein C4558_08155 [Dehalococcoidia bacterium]